MGEVHSWAYDQDNGYKFEVEAPGRVNSHGMSYDLTSYSLGLPHQCESWIIATSPDREFVLAKALKFREDLDAAIVKLARLPVNPPEPERVGYAEAMRSTIQRQCIVRDIRPPGDVLLMECSFIAGPGAGIVIYEGHDLDVPDGPWRREVRVCPDGPWEILGGRNSDNSYWQAAAVPPPGHHDRRIFDLAPGWQEASARLRLEEPDDDGHRQR